MNIIQNIFKRYSFLILLLVSNILLNAQVKITPQKNISDSLKSITNVNITTKPNQQKSSTIDTVIYANSNDSLIIKVSNKKMDLYGDSNLKFKDTNLKSEIIYIDFSTSEVKARGGIVDSVTKTIKGEPILTEGDKSYKGSKIDYNFRTRRGVISKASTSDNDSYYTGKKIKKVSRDTYFIKDGIYTTCDHNPPHYYFYSPKMKMVQNKEIIARWVWLYFGGVPFPVPLPFAVFPIQSGRRSGLIPPTIGNDFRFGQYISKLGYFWAINDNYDLNFTTNYYTRGSFSLASRFRYVKRYDFNGSLNLGYKLFKTGESTDPDRTETKDWQIRWLHHQNINPTTRLDVNIDFTSSNYLNRTSIDFNQVLRNEIVSNATLFKIWEESGNSLTINYSRRQILQSNVKNEVLPRILFTKSQSYPFRKSGNLGSKKWYELFGYNYNGQFQINRNTAGGVSISRGGFLHSVSASVSPKIGHFSIAPSFNYQERWYNQRIEKKGLISSTGGDSVVTNDINEINFVRTFDFRLSASTKFYGIFKPNVFGIEAIRQTVTPSISYNYKPDFSKNVWGYYGSYVNSKGQLIKYNKFEREIFGGASPGEQQNISFNVNNIFEMKTAVDPTDTTSKEKKIQLLNLSAGLSYNFAADSLKLSDLFLSYRTQVGNLFSFSGSSVFTFYDFDETINQRVNRFLSSEGKGLFRMTSFRFSVSTHLAGKKQSPLEKADSTEQKGGLELIQESNVLSRGLYAKKEADFTIPWDLSLNFNYSISKPTPSAAFRFSNINANINFNLTRYWNLSFTGSYDFEQHELVAPQIRISRDLHAWIMNFTWNPSGFFRGYRLEIKVKAPQLSDLKFTKRDQFFSGR